MARHWTDPQSGYAYRDRGDEHYRAGRHADAERELRVAVAKMEYDPGKDHKDTLKAKYWLAMSLHAQEKYSEAEPLFRETVTGQESVFGENHKNTLKSKQGLAASLYRQNKFTEAEMLYGETVATQEKTLGHNHERALDSKYRLALSYYKRGKYEEAEPLYREAIRGQEKTLGPNNAATLNTKYRLALSLYKRQRYEEAESFLREAILGQEMTLGLDHEDTLNSRYRLGLVMYKCERYEDAESILRVAAVGHEKTLGPDRDESLKSKVWLAMSLYKLKRYAEAENHFGETVVVYERTLGWDHKDTLDSVYWLVNSLLEQGRYSEAESPLRELLATVERKYSKDHSKVVRARDLLSELLEKKELASKRDLSADVTVRPAKRDEASTARTDDKIVVSTHDDQVPESSPGNTPRIQDLSLTTISSENLVSPPGKSSPYHLQNHLNDIFREHNGQRSPYSERDIIKIASLLEYHNPRWSRVPRTYIVLRTINCLDVIDDLLASGFSDYMFPTTERTLSSISCADHRSDFLKAQHLVVTKSLDLDKGQHCYFDKEDTVPLSKQRVLGRGAFGQVDEVLSLINYEKYARKRVLRKMKLEHLQLFVSELQIIKRLKHKHVVEFVGSYSDAKYLGLLMRPVAEMDLATYLTRPDMPSRLGELRTFFGCLATALSFLHVKKIRHKDVKPQNILVDRGNVLLTDFGLSRDYQDAQGSTTVSMVNGMTPRYCAPEVADSEPRNTASDVWSLGVVFFEMFVVLKGSTREYIDEFFAQHGSRRPYVRSNPEAVSELIAALKVIGRRGDNVVVKWVTQMIQEQGHLRPTAEQLVTRINDVGDEESENRGYCGMCCAPHHDEEFTDFSD